MACDLVLILIPAAAAAPEEGIIGSIEKRASCEIVRKWVGRGKGGGGRITDAEDRS